MVAFAALLVAFAYLLVLPLQVAAVLPSQFILNRPDGIAKLESKNRTDIPASMIPNDCQSQCPEATLKFMTNCTSSMCMCDDNTHNLITGCLNCLVNTQDSSKKITTPLRDALDSEYATTCATLGKRITGAKVNSASRIFASMGLGNGKAGVVGTVLTAAILSVIV